MATPQSSSQSSPAGASSIQVLLLGLEPLADELFTSYCTGAQFTKIATGEEFMERFEAWQDGMFNAIVCGSAFTGVSALEIAQVLQNQCPTTNKFYLTYDTGKYEPRNLLKNGFMQCFAIPIDNQLLKQAVLEKILTGPPSSARSFRSVRIVDLGAGEPLDFDTFVYLPLNKKHVRLSAAHQKIEPSKLEKMQVRQMAQVFVDHRDMQKFYQYSAKRLRSMGDDQAISATERKEKLVDCVRGLFTDIFDVSLKADFDQGREMVEQCESIISNYITKGSSSNWYKKLMGTIGHDGDTYNHASNVSTFAALFAIGLGHAHPEDLAMAGLFHDIGMTTLPIDIQNKPETAMNSDELIIFYSHPEKSLNFVRQKRIILSETVEKAVLQHHEKFSGKGGPKGLPAGRITHEAQILSFADQFDELMRVAPGKPRLTALEAVDEIKRTGSINPDLVRDLRIMLDTKSENTGQPVKSA